MSAFRSRSKVSWSQNVMRVGWNYVKGRNGESDDWTGCHVASWLIDQNVSATCWSIIWPCQVNVYYIITTSRCFLAIKISTVAPQTSSRSNRVVNLNTACLPDWFPDQNTSAGARTWMHLPRPEGRSPADHPLRQLHQAGAHRVRPCRHREGICPVNDGLLRWLRCHSLDKTRASMAWLIITWTLWMGALGMKRCAHSEVALQEADSLSTSKWS